MNVALLVFMCTLALPHGSNAMIHNPSGSSRMQNYNERPCQKNDDNNAFNQFVQKHILQEDFDRTSNSEWETYLENRGLCRRPVQTFIMKNNENDVVQICNGSGRRVRGNLCISGQNFNMHYIEVNTSDCKVKKYMEYQTV